MNYVRKFSAFAAAAAALMTFVLVARQARAAQAAPERRVCPAVRVNPQAPEIDGRLDDEAWQKAAWQSGFVQYEPYEGAKPTEETSFKILYDDRNLYVGIRAHDSLADSIQKRLSRRDDISGDCVAVMIDSYHDHLTCFTFIVNAAGVRADELMSNDSAWERNSDASWDPLWEARVSVDGEGWTAEMKIPLSQLRFSEKSGQGWGLQVARRLFRNNETSLWQAIPKKAPGWVSQFGDLTGFDGLRPPRQVEVAPYAVGRLRNYEKQAGNPFAPGHEEVLVGGLDGKVGVTHDLTMNFTVNPDFGQVEADPSVINLTAYETWFEEKRPFFVEGKNIIDFQITGGDGDFSYDNLFYSRRIGRAPQSAPTTAGFADMPAATTILGAFKLSGKTRHGLSIGLMESLTSKESASIYDGGAYSSQAVEPLTNYFALRLQQDYNRGGTTVGGMFTAVNRRLDGTGLDFLHREAYGGGFDVLHTWRNKDYYVSLKALFSLVRGSEEALARTQQSPVHYFQRPDAGHVEFDPERTSLSGHGGSFDIGKQGGGRLVYSAGVTWRSPGLELNDMGYLRSGDRLLQYFWAGYRFYKPFAFFRSLNLNVNQWTGWNFAGERVFAGGNINAWAQFKNYWSASVGVNRQFNGLSDGTLRGGPALRVPGGWNIWSSLQTDMRKKTRLSLQYSMFDRSNGDGASRNLSVRLNMIPSQAFNFSLQPSYSWNFNEMQYVGTFETVAGTRWLTGRIDQKTVSLVLRLNLSLAPDLTLQFYGMPFISAGRYGRFKSVVSPRAAVWSERYDLLEGGRVAFDAATGSYAVDENGDGAVDFSFADPDFNFLQFRSNLVARWEFRPGCTVYLVWSQGRTNYLNFGDFDFDRDWSTLFNTRPDNVFLVKFAYTFTL
jgi:hypothetical protein